MIPINGINDINGFRDNDIKNIDVVLFLSKLIIYVTLFDHLWMAKINGVNGQMPFARARN